MITYHAIFSSLYSLSLFSVPMMFSRSASSPNYVTRGMPHSVPYRTRRKRSRRYTYAARALSYDFSAEPPVLTRSCVPDPDIGRGLF
ncbi:hypothetical protein DFH07DRAFT_823111 [Mycena maculata]|uniref:Uncharacterized protein n=1 Tax=Mycena maculata TaxID=230809 RepID=A0AAD7J2E8_9AGAR|nr:hypothetical protein DFH07DRAFT_823111 [Mycena maculata]